MFRIFLKTEQINKEQVSLSKEDYHHLVRVQRVKPKENLEIVLEDKVLLVEFLQILNQGFTFKQIKERPKTNLIPKIILAQALPKQDKFAEILKLCLPLNITKMVPVISKRVVINLADYNLPHKLKRWQNIIKEVACQAKLDFLPELDPIIKLADLVQKPSGQEVLKIVLWEEEQKVKLKEVLLANKTCKEIILLVGPEGGFSGEEIAYLRENGFNSVSLGSSILRTEQAGCFALAAINYEFFG